MGCSYAAARLATCSARPDPGPRHIGSPPRTETRSRGANGAERSELALRPRRRCVALRRAQLSSCSPPEREKSPRICVDTRYGEQTGRAESAEAVAYSGLGNS